MTEQFDGACIKYCKGICCKNVVFLGMTDAELEVIVGNSPVRSREASYSDIFTVVFHSQLRNGVYFIPDEKGTYVVGMKGSCPNLLPDGACGVYEQRPNACRNFEVDAESCRSARGKLRMRPLGKIIVNS